MALENAAGAVISRFRRRSVPCRCCRCRDIPGR